MSRLQQHGSGILLLHDVQPATAMMLPRLLRELKAKGYRVVQMVPVEPAAPAQVASVSETPATLPATPSAEEATAEAKSLSHFCQTQAARPRPVCEREAAFAVLVVAGPPKRRGACRYRPVRETEGKAVLF